MNLNKMKILKLLFCFFWITSFSQIKGHYFWKDESGLTSCNFEFENGFFSQISGTDFGIKIKDKGHYKIIKDTLVLIYDNSINKTPELIKQTELKDSLGYQLKITQFNFEVIFDNNEKALGTTIILRDNENKIIRGFITDNEAKCNLVLSDISKVNNIVIANLNDQIEIKIDNYLYKSNFFKIMLSQKKWKNGNYKGIQKYIIKNKKNKKITLTNITNNQNIILEKTPKKYAQALKEIMDSN